MIALLCPWLMPSRRRPRRSNPAIRPVAEALEARAVLSGSIDANIDGLKPPVVSVTLPQPSVSGVQDVSLILRPSADDPQLLRDSLIGRLLGRVVITLHDGQHGKDGIFLKDAVITSFRIVEGPSPKDLSIAINLEGRTGHGGSIATIIDGVTPEVVNLTIPQPTGSRAKGVSLLVRVSKGVTKLFQDAAIGKFIPKVEIALDRLGNGSTDTISLTGVVISSIQLVGDGDRPTVRLTLAAEQETIRQS
jgi:hypothetical protein